MLTWRREASVVLEATREEVVAPPPEEEERAEEQRCAEAVVEAADAVVRELCTVS